MLGRLAVLALAVLLTGKIVRSMPATTKIDTVDIRTPDNHRNSKLSTDEKIRDILFEISNRIFRPGDAELVTLIKKSMKEAARSHSNSTRASIEAGAKKAQRFVTEVTAAYTQAVFRANSAQEAQEILHRFQDTVQGIVDYAKNGDYNS